MSRQRRNAEESVVGSIRRCQTEDGPRLRRAIRLTFVSLSAIALLAILAPAAGAAKLQHRFTEVFGSAAQPSFVLPGPLHFDDGSGTLLVGEPYAEAGAQISRFNSDGTPAPFAALGTNTIDGREANGRPCSEEPASCDKAPGDGISLSSLAQIAVDSSGGPTDGNIYVASGGGAGPPSILVFASDGSYLGQLGAAGDRQYATAPCGVAVDPAGALYVVEANRIDKFVPSGNLPVSGDHTASFSSPLKALALEGGFCNLALGSGPTAGSLFALTGGGNGPEAVLKLDKETGAFKYLFPPGDKPGAVDGVGGTIAVDPSSGNVIVSWDQREGRYEGEGAVEFDASGESRAVEVARLVPDPVSSVRGLALSSSGASYVSANSRIEVYGPAGIVPTVTAKPAVNITSSEATLVGTVNPSGVAVTDCFFEYGEANYYGNIAPCEGAIPTDSADHPVSANISGLPPNGQTVHYRLAAKSVNGTERSADQTLVTADTVVTEAASVTGTGAATLRGTVRPEGLQYSECFFEYGIVTKPGFEKSIPCSPAAAAIAPDRTAHAVSATLSGLQTGATYRYRLVAANPEGTRRGDTLRVSTFGPPRIVSTVATEVNRTSAILGATVNPSGFATSYRFEWGTSTAYGNRIPGDFDPIAGEGTSPVRVTANVANLQPGAVYHFRLVASSSSGTVVGPDQEFWTLNAVGLPNNRGFELVSPADKGPVASAGKAAAFLEDMQFQAASAGPGLAYTVEFGLPGATASNEVLYRGLRSQSGWSSLQLTPPFLRRSEMAGVEGKVSRTEALSADLQCGVVTTAQPLTPDAPTLTVEAGAPNLYRQAADGSYAVITGLTPVNLEEANGGFVGTPLVNTYRVIGMSPDCSRVVFASIYHYAGVGGAGTDRLYEWHDGVLRNVGVVPGANGPVDAAVVPGAGLSYKTFLGSYQNAVSEDASRIFFSATSQVGPDAGTKAVFVRENGTTTVDVSQSETSTPTSGATYQYASADGRRVFFTANAGLTPVSSSEGTDLYEYNLDTDSLTDLSVAGGPGGADVGGFLGASKDGSHAYFAARGQLVAGEGRTYGQNVSAGTYSVYGTHAGRTEFVGTALENEVSTVAHVGLTTAQQGEWNSRVTPDGEFLLFNTAANVVGYDSGGTVQAYRYSASANATVCISCRLDGKPPIAENPEQSGKEKRFPIPLANPGDAGNLSRPPLTISDDGSRVFFTSPDRLAAGAVDGRINLYQWENGQTYLLATEPRGFVNGLRYDLRFAGASADGDNVYLATTERLSWEDKDDRSDVYDLRVGGGFPEPPPAPAPCSALVEGSCQVPALPASGSGSAPPSSTFSGPGNKPKPKHKKKRCAKGKQSKKAHGKGPKKARCGKSKKRNDRKHRSQARGTNDNRRAGK